jgi:two-component system cell cycle response regulator DivK
MADVMGAEPDTRPVVVYVEDDADTFKLACLRLKTRYRLLWAKNDREAADLLTHHRRELFAVLMDIELAGSVLDGLALTQLLRGRAIGKALPDFAQKLPVLPNLPIILLTAYTTRYTEAETKAFGASHFATKPIDFTRLSLALAQANIKAVMQRLEPMASPEKVAVPPPRRSPGSR